MTQLGRLTKLRRPRYRPSITSVTVSDIKPHLYLLKKPNGRYTLYLGDIRLLKDARASYSASQARCIARWHGLRIIRGRLNSDFPKNDTRQPCKEARCKT